MSKDKNYLITCRGRQCLRQNETHVKVGEKRDYLPIRYPNLSTDRLYNPFTHLTALYPYCSYVTSLYTYSSLLPRFIPYLPIFLQNLHPSTMLTLCSPYYPLLLIFNTCSPYLPPLYPYLPV